MPVFNPIKTDRKLRRFGVFDLEWVPGEALPPLVNTVVEVEGIRTPLRMPLPVFKKMTSALKLRMAGYYDHQVVEVGDESSGTDVDMVERYQHFTTIKELVNFLLVREQRGNWFFAHAGAWRICSSSLTTCLLR